VAGLIRNLKSRGMLDETIVLVTGAFGRTPLTQPAVSFRVLNKQGWIGDQTLFNRGAGA